MPRKNSDEPAATGRSEAALAPLGSAAGLGLPPLSFRARGPSLFLKTIRGRSYPRIIGAQRELSWLLFETVMPFIYMVGMVLAYRAFGADDTYVGAVILGGAMTSYWFNVLWSMATQLFWEKDSGNLALYIASPAPLPAILLGMAIGSIVGTTVRAVVILVSGVLMFGIQFQVSSFGLLGLSFVLCMVSLYGLGMVFSSLFLLFGREAQKLVQILEEPIQFVSGVFFPVKSLGQLFAAVSCLLPLTLGLDSMRQLCFSQGPAIGFLSVPVEIAIMGGMTVVFVPAAIVLLRRIEIMAIRDGKIVEMRK